MADQTSGGGRALDAPGVRGALRTYRRRALAISVVSLVLLVAFLWAVDIVESRATDLEQRAVLTEGEVIAQSVDGRYVTGTVEVTFDHRGQRRVETVISTTRVRSTRLGNA